MDAPAATTNNRGISPQQRQRDIESAFRAAFAEAKDIQGGEVYDQQNVRGLSDANPLGPLVATLHLCSGRTVTLGGDNHRGGEGDGGDGERRFLAQSCFKPLVYAMALERGLGNAVHGAVRCVGDAAFGTFDRAPDGRALNPLINSGALVVLELLSRDQSVEEVGRWCRDLGRDRGAGGGEGDRCGEAVAAPLFDPVAVAATEAESMRNRGLSCALVASGMMGRTTDAVENAVKYYAAMDCLLVTSSELAAVAAAFAGSRPGGSTAATGGTTMLADATRRATLATMLHCGMYEESGAWARDVGVPTKSGVSGCVWAVIPSVGGLCAHQPRTDSVGNSVQAMALMRGIASRCPAISVFAPQ